MEAHAAGATFVYDELGRLVQVVAPDQTSTQYTYDAVGNIVAVRADTTTTLAITDFAPDSGSIGTVVTIFGSGFIATPSSNAVTIGGVAATVTAASATQLTIVVPAGVVTGPVKITNTNGTVTSTGIFTVAGITIDGPTVAINAFQAGYSDTLSFQGTVGQVLGIGLSGLVLDGGGYGTTTLQVLKPDGSVWQQNAACTTSNPGAGCELQLPSLPLTGTYRIRLLSVSAAVNTASVTLSSIKTGALNAGSTYALSILRNGQNANLTFTGSAGQLYVLTVSGVATVPASQPLTLKLYDPVGTPVINFVVPQSATPTALSIPTLATSGVYSVVVDVAFGAFVSANLLLNPRPAATVLVDGPAVDLAPAQGGYGTFNGTAGQNLGLAVTSLAYAINAGSALKVYLPSGALWASNSNCAPGTGALCDLNLSNLPQTGAYRIELVTPAPATSAMVMLSADKTGALSSGNAFALSVRTGQNARLNFPATAGQPQVISISGLITNPAKQKLNYSVLDAAGTAVYTSSVQGYDASPLLLIPGFAVSGTYTLFIDPLSGATATASLLLNPPAANVVIDGVPVDIAAYSGGYASFAGTVGQNLGLSMSGLTFAGSAPGGTTLQVLTPDGKVWQQRTLLCNYAAPGGSCELNLSNLPQTGTYKIALSPSDYPVATAIITLSTDKTANLTPGSAYALSLRSGQNARLSFASVVDQAQVIQLSGLSTTPASQTFTWTVWNPAGGVFSSGYVAASNSSATLTLPKAVTGGTYTLFIDPGVGAAATGSVMLSPSDVSIAPDGAAVDLGATPGGIVFNGVAGQNLGLGLSGLTFAGGASGNTSLIVRQPSGAVWLQNNACWSTAPGAGCELNLSNLPQTGVYRIELNFSSATVTSALATLSTDKTASLTTGVPAAVSVRTGQNAQLAFPVSAGQRQLLAFTGLSTTPAGQTSWLKLTDPLGNVVYRTVTGPNSLIDVPVSTAGGTASAFLDPSYGAAASVSVTLNPTGAAVAIDGAAVDIAASQGGYGTFVATAGQNVGLGLSALTFQGGTWATTTAQVYKPDGSLWLQNTACSSGSVPGCNLYLANLPQTGTYQIRLSGATLAVTKAVVTLSTDKTMSLTSGTPVAVDLRIGQTGRLSIAGTVGQSAFVRFRGMTTTPANQRVNATLLHPSGSPISAVSGNSASNGWMASSQVLPMTGTYQAVFNSDVPAASSMTVVLNPAAEIAVDGAAVPFSSAQPGYGTTQLFQGVAGQNLGLALTGITGTSTVALVVWRPDGNSWPLASACSSTACDLTLTNLPWTGDYLVEVRNYGGSVTASTLTLSSDLRATLASGTPYALTLRSGQNGRLTFAGTAGQSAVIQVSGVNTTPATQNVTTKILAPDGTTVLASQSNSTGGILSVTSLPSTGNFTVTVDPAYGASLTASVTLNPPSALSVDGAPVNIPTTPAHTVTSMTFTGTAGQKLGLGVSLVAQSGLVPVQVNKPDGSLLVNISSCNIANTCDLDLPSLPVSGTYSVQVSNDGSTNLDATLTLSSDKTGTLTSGSPFALSVRNGQNARLTFSATAGQPGNIRFNNIATTPTAQSVTVTLYDPAGGFVAQSTAEAKTDGWVVLVPSLPQTGVYSVFVDPQFGTAANLSVTLNAAPEIVIDGTAVAVSATQPAYGTTRTFNGTAGQNLGLALTGLAISNSPTRPSSLYVYTPDGNFWLRTRFCYMDNPGAGCDLDLTNLPATGVYLINVDNANTGTLTGGSLTLSTDVSATLNAGAPYTANLRTGQNGRLTFTATAGAHSLTVGKPTSVPAGVAVAVTVLKPDGTTLTSGSYSSAGGTLSLGTIAAGVYTVVVNPSYGAQSSVSLTYN